VISSNELKMDLEKVKAIKEWSSPRNIFEVRSFHGISNFYKKFIRKFSGICAPMLDTVKKGHKYFHWTEEVEKSFKLLKEKIIEQPVLVLPDFGKTFQVRCDVMIPSQIFHLESLTTIDLLMCRCLLSY
jgi:hypothetical protein